MLVPKRIALVDFDGVVLRNMDAQRFVIGRVETFVEGRLKFRNPKVLKRFNEEIYQSYGHTLIGLQKMGVHATFHEFNKHLYSDIDPALSLSGVEKASWDVFYHSMRAMNVPIYIFSNASREWCSHFVDPNMYKIRFVQDEWIGFSDESMITLLKPDERVYDLLKVQFPNTEFMYWEDKVINFKHCMDDPMWTKIWVNSACEQVKCLRPNMWMVPSIDLTPPM